MKLIYTLGILSLAVLLSACGENYQAKYVGVAGITGATGTLNAQGQSCGSVSRAPSYDMEAVGTVSGSSLELNIIKFSPSGSAGTDSFTNYIVGTNMSLDLVNNTNFSVNGKPFQNDPSSTYAASGTINTARDEINSLTLILSKNITLQLGQPAVNCTLQIQANNLKRIH